MFHGVLVVCLLSMAGILLVYAVKSYQKKNVISREVAGILGMAAGAAIWYCATILAHNDFLISFAYSLNFICFDGIVYGLYQFSRIYTNAKPLSGWKRLLLWLFVTCDSVSLLLNPLFGHAVILGSKSANEHIYSIITMKAPYVSHLIFCYALFLLCVSNLIIKAVKSPYIYKIKYALLCSSLCAAAVINALFVFTKLSVDLSIFTYAFSGILLYHYTFNYVPGKLRARIFDYLIETSPEGILLFDAEGKCIYRNAKSEEYYQQKNSVLDLDEFCRKVNIVPDKEGGHTVRAELKVLHKGEALMAAVSCKYLLDENARLLGCLFKCRNITKEKKLAAEKSFLSKHDPLTGIYNRNYFFYKVRQFFSENTDTLMVMIALNIERFKLINDVFDFGTGNQLLKELANCLQTLTARQYLYGRIDSDWFAVCIPKEFPVKKLFDACRIDTQNILGKSFPVVINFGIYEIDDKTLPVEVMYDRAMLALNAIKGQYHNQIGYYDGALRNTLLQEQMILNDMENAILEKQFVVYIQPQMNHTNNQIAGAEALVRWNHPTRGMISPADFIPLFEENGFITKLDRYVWESVCQMIQKLRLEGKKDCSISVNISTKDFYHADLYQVFTGLVEKYAIPPTSLKLEITETSFVMDVEKQLALIKKLQDAGFIIEMDDFGSGYSSLNTLKDIPVDVLKMDMNFLSKSSDMERSKNILEMVVSLSKNLGMKVIAEGVETKIQADYLSEIGCEIIQGYYYAKPMPTSDYEDYLNRFGYQDIMDTPR